MCLPKFAEYGKELKLCFPKLAGYRDGADVVFSDGGGRAKKIPAKCLDGGDLRVVENDGVDYVGDSVSGAFRSKMERRM